MERTLARWQISAQRCIHGHTLQLHRWGENADHAPAILLLHGLEEQARMWTQTCPHLEERYQLFSLDMPWSRRESSRWGAFCSPDIWLREALKLLPCQPQAIIAHSFGGNALLEYLQSHTLPTLRALVIVSSYYRSSFDAIDWPTFHEGVANFRLVLQDGIRVRKGTVTDASFLEAMADKVHELTGPLSWTEWFRMFMRTPALDLARLDYPVLVVGGTDDYSSTPASNTELAQAFPHGELSLLECGHFCMLELPDAFGQLVREFLTPLLSDASPDC